jgi:hypothetical protein
MHGAIVSRTWGYNTELRYMLVDACRIYHRGTEDNPAYWSIPCERLRSVRRWDYEEFEKRYREVPTMLEHYWGTNHRLFVRFTDGIKHMRCNVKNESYTYGCCWGKALVTVLRHQDCWSRIDISMPLKAHIWFRHHPICLTSSSTVSTDWSGQSMNILSGRRPWVKWKGWMSKPQWAWETTRQLNTYAAIFIGEILGVTSCISVILGSVGEL